MSSVTSVVWPTPRSHCQHSEGPAAEGRAEAEGGLTAAVILSRVGTHLRTEGAGRRRHPRPRPQLCSRGLLLVSLLSSARVASLRPMLKHGDSPGREAQGEQWVHGEPHLSAPCGQACGPQGGAGCPRLGTVSTGRRGDPAVLHPVPSVVPRHLTARCLQLQCAPETPPHPALRLLDHVPMSTRSKGGLGGFTRRRRRPLGQAAISQ